MKNYFLFLFVAIWGFSTYAQVRFEPGYFIDEEGRRHPVLIKNHDWRMNPSQFEYKTSAQAETQVADLEQVREFQVEGFPKYQRFTVQIDRSLDNTKNLSRQRGPQFTTETLFLKTLLEGAANLYEYTGDDLKRFFYSTEDIPINQLVYKMYQVGNKRGENNFFRQQLFNKLSCGDLGEDDVENLDYRSEDLVDFFRKYNECQGSGSVVFEKEENATSGSLNVKVKAGVSYATLDMAEDSNLFRIGKALSFDKEISPRIGLELEYILPFNRNKWSFFIAPAYEQMDVEKEGDYLPDYADYGFTHVALSFQSVAVPVGFRHYFFLNETSKIHVGASYAYQFIFSGEVDSNLDLFMDTDLDFSSSAHAFEFGLGYTFRDRYSAEVTYRTGRDPFSDYSDWQTQKSEVISFILGYTLF